MFKRLLIRYLPFSLLLLLAISLPMSQVLADCTWAKTFDFTSSEQGWSSIVSYPYTANWLDQTLDGDGQNRISYSYTFAAPTKVTTFTAKIITYDSPISSGGTVTTSTSFGLTGADDPVDTHPPYDDSIMYAVTTSGSASSDITFDIHGGSWGFSIFQIVLDGEGANEWGLGDGCEGGGGGGLGDLPMPLKGDDLHPNWGMYDATYVNSLDPTWDDDEGREPVYAYSDKLGASVHNVVAGTVTAVDNDITSQCETLDELPIPFAPHACYLVLPAVIAGEAISQLFTIQMAKTALVLVKDDEDPTVIYTYFVSNPKVSKGDHVEPGCILGETMALNNSPLHVGDINLGGILGNSGASGSVSTSTGINTIQTGNSVTVVRRDDLEPEITRLYPALTSEPDESMCPSDFDGCLNGASSSLLSLTGWIVSDGVSLLSGGGASLPGGSQIYQTNNMMLDDSTTYTLTVQARSTTTGNGFDVVNRIKLFLGETVEQFPITTQWETFSMEFIGEDMFSGDAYGVVNQNAADVGIEVRYICVSGEGASQAPNSCYFKNHHFDDGPKDWTYDGGVTFTSGQAFMYNDSVIDQVVQLFPATGGGSATYNLTVAGRLIATSAYTGQSGKYVDLSYRFPMSGDYTLIDEIDSTMVEAEGKDTYSGNLNIEHTYVLTIPITISSYTTSLLSIKANVTDGDNYLKGFRIDYACLQSTTDDGSFPGQGGAGFDPPFYENCQVIPVPEDNNINSWTYYHWSNLKRFFDCTLMVKLNSMAQLMDSAWKTTRLFFRWIVATGQFLGRWTSTMLMPWLNGQFRNIAVGQVTTVYQSGGQCSDLFCVLNSLITGLLTPLNNIVSTLLNLIGDAIHLIFDVVRQIITFIIAFLTRLLGLLSFGQGLLGSIVNAYNNSAPIAVPGLPNCSLDPRSSAFCMGIWVLDNTIFSGTGSAIIPMLTGILSIHLLIWAVAEIKRAVINIGETA